MAEANYLQQVFDKKASEETKALKDKYVVHEKRGFLNRPSRLDPIYDELGKTPFDYTNVKSLIATVKTGGRGNKYDGTLLWLQGVLGGDYSQNGNGCGAWSLTHFKMRSKQEYWLPTLFTVRANTAWNKVQFKSADWDVTKLGAVVPGQLTDWETGQYSSPWKVAANLAAGGQSVKLKIDPDAENFAKTGAGLPAGLLGQMLDLINKLDPAGGGATTGPKDDLAKLPANGKAIIIGIDASKAPPPAALHAARAHYNAMGNIQFQFLQTESHDSFRLPSLRSNP